VAPEVLADESSYEHQFEDAKMSGGAFSTLVPASGDLRQLSAASITTGAAATKAEAWLLAQGEWPADAVLDRVIPLERRTEQLGQAPVAFVVRFSRVRDGFALRGNRIEHHISVVVDDSGVVSATKFWPELHAGPGGLWTLRHLPLGWAVQLAAPQLAAMVKGDGLDVVKAEPVYGTQGGVGQADELTPAYALTSTDGSRIVVSAITGEVLR